MCASMIVLYSREKMKVDMIVQHVVSQDINTMMVKVRRFLKRCYAISIKTKIKDIIYVKIYCY